MSFDAQIASETAYVLLQIVANFNPLWENESHFSHG